MSSRKKITLPWAYIPKEKSAVVAVITSVRVADFYQIASFQTCVTLHLQHLRPELSSSGVARHVGVAQGMFTAAQIISAPAWGIAADRIGRKAVILLGLIATASACIGVAFARSIQAVVLWRFFAGATNGTVVAARAAMSDNLAAEHRPAGFSLLVLSFHLANAVGPSKSTLTSIEACIRLVLPARHTVLHWLRRGFAVIAAVSMGTSAKWSLLPVLPAEPSGSGVMSWVASHPYATPNLLSALVLVGDALLVWFKLKEVHQDNYQLRQNWASKLFIYVRRNLCLSKPRYERVSTSNIEAAAVDNGLRLKELERRSGSSEGPLETVWTRNFFIVLCTVAILEFHLGVFGSLWPLFVVAPRQPNGPIKLPFLFTGGLQLENAELGLAIGALGIIGVLLQLTAVPYYTARNGAVRAFKASLSLFPASLFIAPYLALVPADCVWILWLGISVVLILHVIGRSFGILVSILLVNQSTTQPSRRGTVHGIANAVASASRSAGSIAGGLLYGLGLQHDVAGLPWWVTCCFGVLGWILGRWL